MNGNEGYKPIEGIDSMNRCQVLFFAINLLKPSTKDANRRTSLAKIYSYRLVLAILRDMIRHTFIFAFSCILSMTCEAQSIQLEIDLKGHAGDYTQHVSVECDGRFIGDVEFGKPVCAEIPPTVKACTIERRGLGNVRVNLDHSRQQQAFVVGLRGWEWGVSKAKWNSQLWNQQMNTQLTSSMLGEGGGANGQVKFIWSGRPLEPGSTLSFQADAGPCTNMAAVQASLEAAFLSRHHVVTRSELDAVLDEHKLQMSGVTESTINGGELVNADFLVQILCVQEFSEYQLRFIRVDTGEIHSICSVSGNPTKGINPEWVW